MYSYLETWPQWLETMTIIICLILLIIVIIGSGFFAFKIIKKVKEIKLKAAGAEVDIQIESPENNAEIKQSEEEEK
jgi:hypothetical protein